MNNFTSKLDTLDRPLPEIVAEIKQTINNDSVLSVRDYITQNKNIFAENHHYHHVFNLTIGGVNGGANMAEMSFSKRHCEWLIDAINNTKNMSQASSWPECFEEGEPHDALKIVKLFREDVIKGFSDNKIDESQKETGLKIADGLEETYTKLRVLGTELEAYIKAHSNNFDINKL